MGKAEETKIRDAFATYFKDFHITLPDIIPPRGAIKRDGWDIRYICGRDDDRGYIELYAMHRMTNDRHLRIYGDGALETLATVSDGVTFNPDIPGDRQRAERERKDADDPLIADLKKKGLW